LGKFVSYTGKIKLEGDSPRKRETLHCTLDLLHALARLEGYEIHLNLGLRPCTIEQAVNAVRRALIRGNDESESRRRARREERAGRQSTNQAWSSSSDRFGRTSGRNERRDREPAPRPRQAQSAAVEFFLRTTGMLVPFTEKALKHAFRKGVRVLHPDVRPGAAEANGEFCLFQEGYEELKATVN
jgi:hypothetical protein